MVMRLSDDIAREPGAVRALARLLLAVARDSDGGDFASHIEEHIAWIDQMMAGALLRDRAATLPVDWWQVDTDALDAPALARQLAARSYQARLEVLALSAAVREETDWQIAVDRDPYIIGLARALDVRYQDFDPSDTSRFTPVPPPGPSFGARSQPIAPGEPGTRVGRPR
jgi:hypothetical protein